MNNSCASAPETVSIATIPVSLPSQTLSSVGVNDAVPVVAPAEIVISEIVAQSVPSNPVPVVDIVTVISSSATIELVAVKVKEVPAFSAIEVAEVERLICGEFSFSVIVIVTDCEPLSAASAPETDEIEITAVSFPSQILSSVGVKFAVPVVAPAETVMLDKLPQSVPFVDVPAVPRLTVTSSSATCEIVAVNVKDDPAFSAILVSEVVNVTVGEFSFSVIVIVTDCAPSSVADPPETVDIATIPVSLPS